MAKVITTELQHSGASGANITLDSSKNVTCENNLQVDGNVTVTGTLPADKLTGALPAISGASLTGITTRTTPFRNLIINGAFQIAQRDSSSTVVGYGSVDRWKISSGGTDEAPAHFQEALTSSDTGPWEKGFRKALKVRNGNQTSGAGAADYIEIDQEIEAQNVVQSNWQTTSASSYVTLSFWVKSSVAQNFYGYIRTNDNTKQLYCFETGSLSANTWTKVTKTIPGNANLDIDNDAGAGILLRLLPFYGTDMTGTRPLNAWAAYDSAARTPDSTATWYTTNDALFYLTGVQLEPGNTATDFEHKTFGEDLLACQRYYCQSFGATSNTFSSTGGALFFKADSSRGYGTTPFKVEMRAVPTVTICDALGSVGDATQQYLANGIAATAAQISTYGFNRLNSSSAFTGSGPIEIGWKAAAEL